LIHNLGFEEIEAALVQLCTNWNLDMFFIADCTGAPILHCGQYALQKYNLYNSLKIPRENSEAFLTAIESKYLPNPYHNSTHGADVLNSMFYLLENSGLFVSMTAIDLLACVIASL
jgi:hypothetical protein